MAGRQTASKASALESSAWKAPTAGSLLGPPQILPLVERFSEGLHRPMRKNLVLLVSAFVTLTAVLRPGYGALTLTSVARARAALKVLGDLAATTQVIFFTHHQHMVHLAKEAVDREILHIREFGETKGRE